MYQHGSNLPGITTHKKPKRMGLDSAQLGRMQFGAPIKIKAGTTDSGHTGMTSVLRPGGIFVKETGDTGFYVPAATADWASIDKGSLGAITSDEAADTDWDGTIIKLFRNGVQVASVTLAGTDDSTSEVVTALNANASFRNHAIASGTDGNPLVITDVLGYGGALSVEQNLASAWPVDLTTFSVGHAKSAQPDVRIIGEEVAMRDANGESIAGLCSYNFEAGLFRASHLIVGGTQATALADIPAWVRAIFEARGSTFVL